jgi:hypothetical protein
MKMTTDEGASRMKWWMLCVERDVRINKAVRYTLS